MGDYIRLGMFQENINIFQEAIIYVINGKK
jgi:hypothetical protein